MRAFNTPAGAKDDLVYKEQETIFDDIIFSDDAILYYYENNKQKVAITKRKVLVFTLKNFML